jgi:multidrug resistance efflux pump
MSVKSPAPIPVPFRQRWHDFRRRAVPGVVLVAALITLVLLWKEHIAPPTLVGQAEPVVANVSCYKPGVLAQLTASRFQKVKAGDPVGLVMVTDPKILASSLAVIQAEIEMLRAEMKPVTDQQRTAMDYGQLRLDWMRQRAQLATARVNLQLAETEYHRMDELFKEKIVAQRLFEQAQAARDRLQSEVAELTHLVSEGERSFQQLQLTNSPDISKVSADSWHAAIALQESKLRLTEAELSPVTLKAPIDGIVTTIYKRPGEAVSAAQPIMAIATSDAVRIVGYMRPPILDQPQVGMRVEVRTRGLRRQTGTATVVEVGAQFEAVPPTLLGPMRNGNVEQGLPVDISLPANLKIRPGELVDLVFAAKAE